MRARLLVCALIGVMLSVAFVGRDAPAYASRFGLWVQSLGALGPVVFIVAYGLAAVLLFPAIVLTISAGALFGLPYGVLYTMIGATLGAALAFLMGRYVARHFVEKLLLRQPKLAAIDRAVERRGLRLVLLLRLSPAVPYTLLNYALGLSRVRFGDYLLGTVGMLPVVAMYVYSGKVAGDLASLASGAAVVDGPGYYVVLSLGLVATVAVTVYVTQLARRAIEEELSSRPMS